MRQPGSGGMLRAVARLSADFGLDLGQVATLGYAKGRGVIFAEPSIVALKYKSGHRLVSAVGTRADTLLAKGGDVELLHPMRYGVITDFEAAQQLTQYFVRKLIRTKRRCQGGVIVRMAQGSTAIERRVIRDAARTAGAKHVSIITRAAP